MQMQLEVTGFPAGTSNPDALLALRQCVPQFRQLSSRTNALIIEVPVEAGEQLCKRRHIPLNNAVSIWFTRAHGYGDNTAASPGTSYDPPSSFTTAVAQTAPQYHTAPAYTTRPVLAPSNAAAHAPLYQSSASPERGGGSGGSAAAGVRPQPLNAAVAMVPSAHHHSYEGQRNTTPPHSLLPVLRERQWVPLPAATTTTATAAVRPAAFTVATWNILATTFAQKHATYCPEEYLRWPHRQALVTAALDAIDADAVLLQEVTSTQDATLSSYFAQRGYAYRWMPKVTTGGDPDGVAIALRESTWKVLVEAKQVHPLSDGDPHVGLCVLAEHKASHAPVIFATTHLSAAPELEPKRQAQAAQLVQSLRKTAEKYSAAIVLGGDFNSAPRWGLVDDMKGKHRFLEPYTQYPDEAFAGTSVTCYQPAMQGCVDYVFYADTAASTYLKPEDGGVSLVAAAVLQVPSDRLIAMASREDGVRAAKQGASSSSPSVGHLPSPSFPSDHIPLACRFNVIGPTTAASTASSLPAAVARPALSNSDRYVADAGMAAAAAAARTHESTRPSLAGHTTHVDAQGTGLADAPPPTATAFSSRGRQPAAALMPPSANGGVGVAPPTRGPRSSSAAVSARNSSIDPRVCPYACFFLDPNRRGAAPFSHEEMVRFSDAEKTSIHDFIQWLFPNERPSDFNRAAPPMSPEDKQQLRTNTAIHSTFNRGLEAMLGYWGIRKTNPNMRAIDGAQFEFDAADPQTAAKRDRLLLHLEGHLRMTRVLKSLQLFGFDATQYNLVRFLREFIERFPGATRDAQPALDHWIRTLPDSTRLSPPSAAAAGASMTLRLSRPAITAARPGVMQMQRASTPSGRGW